VAISYTDKKEKLYVPRSIDVISANDDLAVVGRAKKVRKLAEEYGWIIKDGLEVFGEYLAPTNAGMTETVVSPRSELIGKTMSEVNFKEQYSVNPVALFTGQKIIYSGLTHVRLRMGDTLLLHGPWDRFHILRNKPQPRALTFATTLEGEIMRPEKAKLAVIWLAVALTQIIVFKTQLSVALMSGALGMIITGVLSVDEAYYAVDWMTVFLLAGLIPLGMAFEKTGTAAFIAKYILGLLGQPSPICGRYGFAGSLMYEHGGHGRRRPPDGCTGRRPVGFQHFRPADPSGQRPDYATWRVSNGGLCQGGCSDDRHLFSGRVGHSLFLLRDSVIRVPVQDK
jgi:K+/H+ antiporter YhaU regulatory subunit KhtT